MRPIPETPWCDECGGSGRYSSRTHGPRVHLRCPECDGSGVAAAAAVRLSGVARDEMLYVCSFCRSVVERSGLPVHLAWHGEQGRPSEPARYAGGPPE